MWFSFWNAAVVRAESAGHHNSAHAQRRSFNSNRRPACSVASPARVPRTGAFHGRRVPSTRASLRREPSGSRGGVVEALERQVHVAARIDMTGGVHRRMPSRADAPAGDQNHPMIVFVAIAAVRSDIDRIGAVVVMFAVVVLLAVGRETIPCICRTYRGRTHDSRGEETCISCRNHLIAPLSADALLAWLFSKRRGRCLL
jgi:hypothetical protein